MCSTRNHQRATSSSNFCYFHFSLLRNAKSKCEEAQRRPRLGLSGAEEKEAVRDSSQLQTLCSELAPSGDSVWCGRGRDGERQRVSEGVLMRYAGEWDRWRSRRARLEWRPKQSRMSYDAPAGSLVSGLWKQPFNPQPLTVYSICFLECIRALRFRGPLCLI